MFNKDLHSFQTQVFSFILYLTWILYFVIAFCGEFQFRTLSHLPLKIQGCPTSHISASKNIRIVSP